MTSLNYFKSVYVLNIVRAVFNQALNIRHSDHLKKIFIEKNIKVENLS